MSWDYGFFVVQNLVFISSELTETGVHLFAPKSEIHQKISIYKILSLLRKK